MTASLTPYELVFGASVFEAEHFPAIETDLAARGAAASEPAAFVMLASVGQMLRALRPPEDISVPTARDAVLHYGALAFQAWHFRAEGKRLFTLDGGLLDLLVALDVVGPWPFTPPARAGYVQMPRHRVWTRVEEAVAAEPVDGFFWTVIPEATGAASRLDVVLCTGLRPGRPGLGAIEVAAWLPADPPGHWGDIQARDAGSDFENVLPGGELGGLYALTNAAEVLKLLSRLFWYASKNASAPYAHVAAAEDRAPSAHALPPSQLQAISLRVAEG
jgi:hypothetical protein